MSNIAVLTTGRQDWGILRNVCRLLNHSIKHDLSIIAGGMHMSKRHGYTYKYIEEEDFGNSHKLKWIEDEEPSSPEKNLL